MQGGALVTEAPTSGTWRLLVDGTLDGARNMALDRAILAGRAEGTSPPTVRVYRWAVPTVSLGRFQKLDQVDIPACEDLGFDVVRRPTGGRGVLHDDELTYSIVASTAEGVPRGVPASYRHLCEALAGAYRALGVDARLTSRDAPAPSGGACYLQTTRADLALGAAKLSGSAQVWERDAVLQHGSFVVSRDVEAEARVFGLDGQERVQLAEHTATLESVLGCRPDDDSILSALAEACRRVFGVNLAVGEITPLERERAQRWTTEHSVVRARKS